MKARDYEVHYIEEFTLEAEAEWHFEDRPEAYAFMDGIEPMENFAGGRIMDAQMQKGMEGWTPGEPPYAVTLRLAYGFPYVADLTGDAIASAWNNLRQFGAKSIMVSAQQQGTRVVTSA